MTISLFHYIMLSGIIFLIGVLGIFLNRKSIISLIMSVEIILLAININFVAFANFWNDLKGQIFVLFILAVSAAEIAVALAAIVTYFNNRSSNWVDDLDN
ncbi:NADH-quinone oxidoreductase subunit K [Candidatus Hepatincolaceae symbiont of Richtersius coronifer]